MALKDMLEALGIERVIWVDDMFGEPKKDLALLAKKYPTTREAFPELGGAFDLEGFGDVDAALSEAIESLPEERREELSAALVQLDAEAAPAPELELDTIDVACGLLGISPDDRWTFEEADANLAGDAGDDTSRAYIIDLKEAGTQARRGLDAVRLLIGRGSRGVAFILTHETAAVGEAQLESDLTQELGEPARMAPPLTVISKDRLSQQEADIEASLAIALKRAGLRRALYQVLTASTGQAAEAFASTARSLLTVDPERLEQYVYERGRAEGVSEMSVVERALSAGASKWMRKFFGTDAIVLQSVQILRALQSVSLDNNASDAGQVLADLRSAELWDDGELINGALTPLANGDVFSFDPAEPDGPKSELLFVLLGQPCDVALRADGKRQSEFAMLVPIKELKEDGTPIPDPNDPEEEEKNKLKEPAFPFRMRGKPFKLDIRNLTFVRISILDLACFRTDGCVRVEAEHNPPQNLLLGAKEIYAKRTQAADDALAAPMPGPVAAPVDDRLLLTMSEGKPWKGMRLGKRLAEFKPQETSPAAPLPERVTWFLRREGRIRAPYSSFLLERVLRTLGRRAFDGDFAD